MELTNILAKHIINSTFEDIPQQAVEGTKQIVLDQLAVALAGSNADGAVEVVEEVIGWGGKAESAIWVYGNKVPVAHAAFANSVMSHAWDFDDTHIPSICHCGVVTVPPAFALAECRGKIKGKEFITAVNVGMDVQVRLSMGSTAAFGQGWHPTAVFGGFGCGATAGRLLALSEKELINAFGLIYSQTCGNLQCIEDGALSKRLQPGFVTKAALNAVALAKRGVTGAHNVFEGKYGLYPLYVEGKYEKKVIISELGKQFETSNLTIKPHPGCILAQPFESALVSFVTENDLKPEEVEYVTVHCGTKSYTVPGSPVKIEPHTIVDAQFSMYYKVANAIVRRQSTVAEYTEEAVRDPKILDLAKRVKLKLAPEYDTELHTESGGKLEIKTNRRKEIFSIDVGSHKGTPENPMTWEDLGEKLRSCAATSAKPIPEGNVDRLVETVQHLENVEDVTQIVNLVVARI